MTKENYENANNYEFAELLIGICMIFV